MRPILRRLRLIAAALLAAAVLSSVTGCRVGDPAPTPPPPTADSGLRIAVPAYVNAPDSAFWQSLIEAVPEVRDVIVNPDTGPGPAVSESYVQLIGALRDAGIRVLGFVPTAYGARDPALVRGEIDRWKEWYGVDNIFFDEAPVGARWIPTYASYAAIVHDAGGVVVLNPGLIPDRGYFEFADAIVTFEDSVGAYFKMKELPKWVRAETRTELWHIVIGAPEDRLGEVVKRARQHCADKIYVTDDVEPNPYDRLPSYWLGTLDATGSH